MASPGATQNQSSPSPVPPFDMQKFFDHPASQQPQFPPYPTPSSSYPPPTAPFPFPPQLHQHQIHPPPPPAAPGDPLSHLLIQRSLSFPTPPLNPNPNATAGARLMALLGSTPAPPPATPSSSSLPALPVGPARMPSSKVPIGRHLMGEHLVYDVDVRVPGEVQPQLEVTPITKYASDPQLVLGRQIAVNRSYICYGLKQGNIRVLNMNTASRSLLRGHTQRVTDMAFFAEDVQLLASASTDGRICVWKIVEGPEEDDKLQITGNTVIAIQVIGEEDKSVHPRVCWHCHKQEILVVGIGRHVLRIDTIKVGKSGVSSAEDPLQCAVDKLISGVQLVGLHDGEVTDLSMCQWMTSRLVSASMDGTIKIWEDQKGQLLFVLKPHDGHPVNSATFVTNPQRPDHIVLLTAGPLNREVKVWASESEGGWLLPSDAESWKCTQTLLLRSSAEAQTENAFFNQVLVLSQTGLLLLANAKKNAIYAVHLEYGPDPSSTRMDYLAEFTVRMPILSFTGTTDTSPFGEQIVQVYCVQTQAIQQYALDLFLCMPLAMENLGLETSNSVASCDGTNAEEAVVASSQTKTSDISSTGSAANLTEKVVSSDASNAENYLVSSAAEISVTREMALSNAEPRISAMGRASSDTNIVSIASPPSLTLSPRLSRQPSDHISPSMFETSFLLSDHSRNQAITDFSVQRHAETSSADLSYGPTSDNDLRRGDSKASEEQAPSSLDPPAVFKHPTHLITPSEILGVAPSSGKKDTMRRKSDVEKTIQDVGLNGDVCNVVAEDKVVSDGSTQRDGFSAEEPWESVADSNGKFFCSQASDLGIDIAKECLAGSLESYNMGKAQHSIDTEVVELSAQPPYSDDINASSNNVSEEVCYPAVSSQGLTPATIKSKKKKGKNSQAMTSPSAGAFNSADSSFEPVTSSNLHSIEAAFPQILAMQEKLNQIMAMQKEMKKQMTATVSVPDTKEGRRLEASLARSTEKAVKANFDALWVHFQEENVKNEKLQQDRVQQIINVLGNLMNKDLPAALEKIVKRECASVQTNVPRAITAAITESFQKGVGDKAMNQLEKSISSKLEASIARQIPAQLQTSVRQALQDALNSNVEVCMVPAFEMSCRAMFEQIDATFQRGMTEHATAAMQHLETLNSPVTLALKDAINSASSMTHTLNGELAEALRKFLSLAVAGANPSAVNTLVNQLSNGPLANLHEKVDIPIDPRKELSRLISVHKYEEAFTSALQRSDVSIVSWLCTQVDLRLVLATVPPPLSQGVLLSLLQQLACDINNDPTMKLSWMTDVAGAINPSDPLIAVHSRPLFEQVYQVLNHQQSMPTLAGQELMSIRLLMHVINSLLITCK